MQTICDIFVIGGGINGVAIAADAAGRGLSVTLCEKGDLASGTSSASSKLIHGGLRYLEFYEFNVVRKALHEREILLQRAPNIITPLEFVLPYEKHLRSPWLIRFGLFLYDHLSRRNYLPSSSSIDFKNDLRGAPLKAEFLKGFSYYDCYTDDARLVVLNAMSAQENGATILTHTQFASALRENNLWKIVLKNSHSAEESIHYAKALINAAGPWVKQVQENISDSKLKFNVELVKGSHIVVPKLYDGDFAYILECDDKRIIFAIPYQEDFTLIGTTDKNFNLNLDEVTINADEKEYLCRIINYYFQKNITLNDIVWSYSGVRCLQAGDDGNLSEITREYKLLLDNNPNPLLTVIGGKLTTHRVLAEGVLALLQPYFPAMKKPWTAFAKLPGSDFAELSVEKFSQQFKSKNSWLPEKIANRYVRDYGTNANKIIANATSLNDLGKEFPGGLYQKEIEYLLANEWAETAEDILWRRTKLGLVFSEKDVDDLKSWLTQACHIREI